MLFNRVSSSKGSTSFWKYFYRKSENPENAKMRSSLPDPGFSSAEVTGTWIISSFSITSTWVSKKPPPLMTSRCLTTTVLTSGGLLVLIGSRSLFKMPSSYRGSSSGIVSWIVCGRTGAGGYYLGLSRTTSGAAVPSFDMIVVFLFFGDSWVSCKVVPCSLRGVKITSSSPWSVLSYWVDYGISRGFVCGLCCLVWSIPSSSPLE